MIYARSVSIISYGLIISLLLIASENIFAHPGALDANGCHTNKQTDEYHCHNKSNAPQQKSFLGDILKKIIPPVSQTLRRVDYEGFTIWLDCARRGAVKFQYNAQRDTGNFPRKDDFYLDPKVPENCQQTSTKPYGKQYDRGHLVPANHLDYSESTIKATNNMTNILPQVALMNRGAWLQTEEIIECYRDIDELLVIGGVIWGNNKSDDYFLQSHGVATPDAFWKVIIRGTGQDERALAWIIPNSTEATRQKLDSYLVTVAEIEKITREKIPVANYAKQTKPSASWLIPAGCNKD